MVWNLECDHVSREDSYLLAADPAKVGSGGLGDVVVFDKIFALVIQDDLPVMRTCGDLVLTLPGLPHDDRTTQIFDDCDFAQIKGETS